MGKQLHLKLSSIAAVRLVVSEQGFCSCCWRFSQHTESTWIKLRLATIWHGLKGQVGCSGRKQTLIYTAAIKWMGDRTACSLGFSTNKVRTVPENWLSYAPVWTITSPSSMPGVVTKARYVRAGERRETIALGQRNPPSSKNSLVIGMLMSAIADNEILEWDTKKSLVKIDKEEAETSVSMT